VPLGPLGEAPFGFDTRYARVKITQPAGSTWTDAFGFQMDISVSGRL
jgi:hypothetical protein